MTVAELIIELQSFDQDAEVKTIANSHDHWQNMTADDVIEVAQAEVVYSDYHRTDKLLSGDADRSDYDEIKNVVAIGGYSQ